MMLQRLKEYAERIEAVQPSGYSKRRIRWDLALDDDGRLLECINLANGTSGREAAGMELAAPNVVRSSGDRATLLADTGEYALGRPARTPQQRKQGIAFDPVRARKIPNRHAQFAQLVTSCAAETREPGVVAVAKFLDRLTPFDQAQDPYIAYEAVRFPEELEFGDQVTFSLRGERPIGLDSVKAFWERQLQPETFNGSGDNGTCLVCGESKPLLRRMPLTIKRIPGGQSSGNALISANSAAFESYGLENSLIAGCCRPCAEAFHAGLQALIDDAATSLRDAEQVSVFWSRSDQTVNLSMIEDPTPESVEELLRSVLQGTNPIPRRQQPDSQAISELLRSPHTGSKAAVDLVQEPRDFFCLTLAASGSRIAVEAWIETSVEEAKRNLARYFALQRLIRLPRDPSDRNLLGKPVRLRSLQRSLLRSNANPGDLPPKSVRVALLKTALTGAKLPNSLLAQAVKRCQLEQRVSYERAVLIKMILNQRRTATMNPEAATSEDGEEHLSAADREALDSKSRNPAYLCGRAFAVLADIQRAAIPGAKATVVDRFFAGASHSPRVVFARLVVNAQNHLGKIRGPMSKPGLAVYLDRRLGDILARLVDAGGWPPTLTLEQQGEFCLGYYHERNRPPDNRAAATLDADSAQPGAAA